MPLEATMVLLDNSEYSINSDWTPTRWEAQVDAVHVVLNRKLIDNPENTVGIMTMAGKTPEVLVTPTQDEGQLVSALHKVKQSGEADLATAINVASLALKHRQNKNQRQRIIAFVGSPVSANDQQLVRLGKKMKKNNVSIDLVVFGAPDDLPGSSSSAAAAASTSMNTDGDDATAAAATSGEPQGEEVDAKLTALHQAVNNSDDSSHLVRIAPGPYLLSERLISSPILRPEGGDDDMMGGSGGGGGSGGDDGLGVDPNLDPELAMALRMSLEEERARQAAQSSQGGPSESLPAVAESAQETIAPAPEGSGAAPETLAATEEAKPQATSEGMQIDEQAAGTEGGDEIDEEAALKRALELSKQDEESESAPAAPAAGEDAAMQDAPADEDEEDDVQRAIRLSLMDQDNVNKDK